MLGVTSQTLCTYFGYVKDLKFGQGGWGKNLGKAVFMSVYRRLAVNSIEKREKGEVPHSLLAMIVV